MELDPVSIKPFFKAYKLRCKEQVTMSNIEAWRIGTYVCEAVSACFSGGKHKYPDKPHDLTAREETPSENSDMNSDAIKFSAWTKMFNKGFTQKQQTATEPQ